MESIVCLMGFQDVVARIHPALLHALQRHRAAISAPPDDFFATHSTTLAGQRACAVRRADIP
ncbi:hypothetical protein [Massilia sp. CFBP9026]|uniref:hypothetical protein n=1 Tax=Massilia sp. CFBP9026 TaxID=3096536 RepID=UPI002A6B5850|nr:hypothetical protein [Massilia sp. CFBP9026]MDY0962931.1 hypothetical protein [Massilia sp. CFBP9026]